MLKISGFTFVIVLAFLFFSIMRRPNLVWVWLLLMVGAFLIHNNIKDLDVNLPYSKNFKMKLFEKYQIIINVNIENVNDFK